MDRQLTLLDALSRFLLLLRAFLHRLPLLLPLPPPALRCDHPLIFQGLSRQSSSSCHSFLSSIWLSSPIATAIISLIGSVLCPGPASGSGRHRHVFP